MSEKRKSTSPSAIQVKHWQKTVSIEELLKAISWLEKGEWIVDTCHNVRIVHSCTHTIHDNADRIKDSAKSRTKMFVCVARLPQSYQYEPHQKLCIPVSYIFIAL
jgi:IS30 family transposase